MDKTKQKVEVLEGKAAEIYYCLFSEPGRSIYSLAKEDYAKRGLLLDKKRDSPGSAIAYSPIKSLSGQWSRRFGSVFLKQGYARKTKEGRLLSTCKAIVELMVSKNQRTLPLYNWTSHLPLYNWTSQIETKKKRKVPKAETERLYRIFSLFKEDREKFDRMYQKVQQRSLQRRIKKLETRLKPLLESTEFRNLFTKPLPDNKKVNPIEIIFNELYDIIFFYSIIDRFLHHRAKIEDKHINAFFDVLFITDQNIQIPAIVGKVNQEAIDRIETQHKLVKIMNKLDTDTLEYLKTFDTRQAINIEIMFKYPAFQKALSEAMVT